jgi:DNA-directed RNA polymerase subunit F
MDIKKFAVENTEMTDMTLEHFEKFYGLDLSKCDEFTQNLLQNFIKYGASEAIMSIIYTEQQKQKNKES